MSVPLKEWLASAPWLRDLPKSWQVTRFKAVTSLSTADNSSHDDRLLSLSTSKGIVPKEYDDENRIRSGEDLHRYWRVREGHLIVNPMWLAHGSVAASAIQGVISPDYRVYETAAFVDPRYLALLLRANEYRGLYDLFVRGNTTYDRRVSKDDFHSVPVVVPPLDQQRAVATFLDRKTAAIDALITKKDRFIGLVHERRQALITQAVTRGLDPSVPMKHSGTRCIGPVPRHWRVLPLRRVIAHQLAGPYGSSLTKAMYISSGIRVYGQQQVIPDDFMVGDYYISSEKFAEMRKYEVHPGDLLVTVMGTIGRVAVVPKGVERGIMNPRLVRYVIDQRHATPEYIAWALRSAVGISQLAESAQGSTMDGLNLGILGGVVIALPRREEQDEIVARIAIVDAWSKRLTGAVERQIERLREYRQALITAAVTGKIDLTKEAA